MNRICVCMRQPERNRRSDVKWFLAHASSSSPFRPSTSLLLEAELIAHAVSRFQSTLHPSFRPSLLPCCPATLPALPCFADPGWSFLRPGSGCQLLHSMRQSDNQFGGAAAAEVKKDSGTLFFHPVPPPPLLFLLVLPSPAEFGLHCSNTMRIYAVQVSIGLLHEAVQIWEIGILFFCSPILNEQKLL